MTFTFIKTSLYHQRSKTIPQLRRKVETEYNLWQLPTERWWRPRPYTCIQYPIQLITLGSGNNSLWWWYLLYLSVHFLPVVHTACLCRWCYVPLVLALIPGKNQATYTRFFQLLKDYFHQNQLQLQLDNFQLDYKTVVHNAAVFHKHIQTSGDAARRRNTFKISDAAIFKWWEKSHQKEKLQRHWRQTRWP